MIPSHAKGMLIALEGIDGSGKTTLSKIISEQLSRLLISNTPVNPKHSCPALWNLIYSELQKTPPNEYYMQTLWAASRFAYMNQICDLLVNGHVVLVDRYKTSNCVYGIAMGLDYNWCWSIGSPLPEPDLTILLDIDIDTSMTRSGSKDSIENNRELIESCRDSYTQIANNNPKKWIIIDASQSIESVSHQACDYIITILQNAQYTHGDNNANQSIQ